MLVSDHNTIFSRNRNILIASFISFFEWKFYRGNSKDNCTHHVFIIDRVSKKAPKLYMFLYHKDVEKCMSLAKCRATT